MITDEELEGLKRRLGAEAYWKEYHRLYQTVRNRWELRASDKKYENPPGKIKAIKEKYKNGVTEKHIKEWLENDKERDL